MDRQFDQIVILTGAGISAESGVATFRDADGLWEGHDPMAVATPEAFARDPELVYRFYNARREQLHTVKPNPAHRALADLARQSRATVTLITQNVDDLHERGGSAAVYHMHGELMQMRCLHCGHTGAAPNTFDGGTACPTCHQQGGLRPDIVWFGEIPYYMDEIDAVLSHCDLFVAIGTSGAVYPAAGFVQVARAAGAYTLEINRDPSDVSGLFHECRRGLAGEMVPQWVAELLLSESPTRG